MRRLCLIAWLCAAPAAAQTATVVTATSKLEFAPSPDHDGVNEDGTPIVDHYDFTVTLMAGTFVKTRSLGKPAYVSVTKTSDGAVNLITVPVPELVTFPSATYVATVSAVGSGGTAASAASDPFKRQAPPKLPVPPGRPLVRP